MASKCHKPQATAHNQPRVSPPCLEQPYCLPPNSGRCPLHLLRTLSFKVTAIAPGSTMQCELLTDEIKQLLRRVLALMPDPQTNRRCLLKFTGRNIMVDLESQKPPDFSALLDLMASSGDVASYTIQHHCSLVWAIDKELFTRIHDNLHNVLRQQKPQDYKDVMNNLLFPPNWDIEIQQNTYLHQCYKGSTYQPQGRNPGRQVLRYTRNSYTHGLEHSMNKQTLQQMYDQSQLGEMIETVLPLLLHSFGAVQ